MSDYIKRSDAIGAVCRTRCGDKAKGCPAHSCLVIEEFDALLSADAVSREHHDMEIKELKHQIKDQADAENTVSMYSFTELLSEYRGVCEDNENLKKEIAEYEDALKYWQEDCSKLEHKLAESREKAVQGEWIWRTDIPIGDGRTSAGYICSNCGKDYWHGNVFNYCPNCGAKNKGDDDDNA